MVVEGANADKSFTLMPSNTHKLAIDCVRIPHENNVCKFFSCDPSPPPPKTLPG